MKKALGMQYPVSEKQSPKKKLVQRVWFWILIGLVLLVAIFFSMLPVGVDYGIKRYIKNQGADQVSLKDVDFNPITGRMTLTNLSVKIGTQTVLQIPEATLKIKWTPFVRKRFVLERLTISDTQLAIEELENGNWRIGGITLPQRKETSQPSSWNFSFQEASVTNSKIELISPRLKTDLAIEQAKLSKLTSWLHDDMARLEFAGQLNDALIQLQLDVAPFGSEIVASGKIKLTSLSLTPFAQLLQPHLKTLEGHLDLDLNIETRQAAGRTIDHFQKGSVKLHQLHTQIADVKLSKEDLAWNGAVRVNLAKSEEGMKVSADGQLNGSKLTLDSENENLMLRQDKASWKGKINYVQDNTQQKINTDGQISLVGLKMESPQLNLTEEGLTWQGPLQFNSSADTKGQRIIADGVLDGNQLQMSLPGRKLKFEHQGLSWKGRLDTGETNDFSAIKSEADITLKDITILQPETNQRLLNSNQFDLQAIKIDGLNTVNVSGIVLNGLALLAGPEAASSSETDPSPVRIQEVKLGNIRLSQQKDLAIDTIQLRGVKGFLHRDREGKWPAIDRMSSIQSDISPDDQTQRASSDKNADQKSDSFKYRIGQVGISGDSGLRFRDESVQPAFDIDLSVLEARLSDLDNTQSKLPASIKLLVSDTENARLSLEGTLQPFAEKVSLNWVGKIKALELPHLSPYVIRSTGYRFSSGELEANVPLKITQNDLIGEIDLILYNPKIRRTKTANSEKQQKGIIQLNMTLPSALKLLRDKQSNVKLNIPISGNTSDPRFSVTEAINQALAKTLQTSALSYLKFMLGPYGIGITVAEMAYKNAFKIRLNPVPFAPGSAELDEAAIDYLQRVATIMKEYPTVQVSVCGVATESDRTSISESISTKTSKQSTAQELENGNKNKTLVQKEATTSIATDAVLLELAEKRIDRIKDQLVKVHGTAANRIIDCTPEIDNDVDAKPRVNLEI
ncbi:MAG: DUF748 domain-containing protein [Desulfobacterales bacterium]